MLTMTAGELRAALEGVEDHMPVLVEVDLDGAARTCRVVVAELDRLEWWEKARKALGRDEAFVIEAEETEP